MISALASSDVEAVAPAWEELAERVQAAPFLRPGWITAWWNAFGKGRLELRCERRPADERVCALLSVQCERGTLASPTNWHSPEFGLLAESAEDARRLVAAVLVERPRRLSLAFVDPQQAALAKREALAQGFRVIQRTLQRSPHVAIDGDWEAYRRRLSKGLRDDLKRSRRLLFARGKVSFEVSSGARLDEFLEQGFEVEASGWKGERGTAIRDRPAERRFYTEVARWAAARGWLRLAFLRLDGRALAFDFCLEHAGVHYLIKTGYDPACRELGPGKLLREEMLARAFREGLRSYELLGDAEPWKLRWTSATRPRELVQVFRPTPLGLLDWSLFRHGRPLAKRIRALAPGHRRAEVDPSRDESASPREA
jgi:CelD/BcsL family acetyltransferase involved in cellulose biosynthesis